MDRWSGNTDRTRCFFFNTSVPKIIRTQSTRASMKYKQESASNHKISLT